ncbi:hypothetical protein ACFX2F_039810 [Malus domestica]
MTALTYFNLLFKNVEGGIPSSIGILCNLKFFSYTNCISRSPLVLTSSIVSIVFTGKPLSADAVVDESWFSDPAFCEKSKLWYPLSKTLAEEAAWKFAEENGINLVAVNPGMNPSASGRYSIVGSVAHCSVAVKTFRDLFPALKLLEKCKDDRPFTPTYQISKERAQTLDVEFTPLEVSLKDAAEGLKEKNFF